MEWRRIPATWLVKLDRKVAAKIREQVLDGLDAHDTGANHIFKITFYESSNSLDCLGNLRLWASFSKIGCPWHWPSSRSGFSRRGESGDRFYVPSRSEPRLAPFAGEPFFRLCLGMEANNVLLLPAKGMCRYETPRYPYPDRLRVKGDRICNIGHTDNYEPLWSLPLAALAPAFVRSAWRRAATSRRHRRSRQASSRLFRNVSLGESDSCAAKALLIELLLDSIIRSRLLARARQFSSGQRSQFCLSASSHLFTGRSCRCRWVAYSDRAASMNGEQWPGTIPTTPYLTNQR